MGRVMIVDDNLEQCRPVMRLLKLIGHDADCVESGPEALRLLGQLEPLPDLVVLDVMMPGMDGAEVLRQIRDDPRTKSLPVVMYTAVADPLYQAHLLHNGANECWTKARMDFGELQRHFARYLGGPAPAGSS